MSTLEDCVRFLPIHVKTGYEANVAKYIRQKLERLYNSNPEVYASLRFVKVLHFTPRVEQVDSEKTQRRSKSLLPGYIYIGFVGLDHPSLKGMGYYESALATGLTDEMYYHLKVPGVIRLLKAYSTKEEINVLLQQNECEVHLVVAETTENIELISKVKRIAINLLASLTGKSVDQVEDEYRVHNKAVRHGCRAKQILQMPVRVLREMCKKIGVHYEDLFSLPDIDDPTVSIRKEKVGHSLDMGWLLSIMSQIKA